MSPELAFILTLALRMAFAAAFVVTASIVTERSGPVIGALIATLPISAGPSYVFLALDHDAAFIAEGALASLPINAATIFLGLTYVVLAQRHGALLSCLSAVAVWLVLATFIRSVQWSLAGGLLANVVAYAICVPLLARYRHAKMPPIRRRWYDIPLRASLVATLVATVITTSSWVGPKVSGMIALFPIVFTSMMLILHPRIGGRPTAAVLANSAWGLIGLGIAIAVLHVAALQFGSAVGLSLALATCIGWNLGLWWQAGRPHAPSRKFDGRQRGDPLGWRRDGRGRAVEGLYKVEYDISGGTGRSVLYAHAGTMLGGNTAFAHFGTYENVDGEIIARLRTRRHSPSPHRRNLVSANAVTISIRGRPQGDVWHFAGSVIEDAGSVFRAVMTPLGNDDIPPPGPVGEGGIVSGLYSIDIRMLDGIAGGQTGVMLLKEGRILGGDAFFYYLGAYSSLNGRWKGEFVNQEHTPARDEHPLFGGHEVGIGFSGRCRAEGAEMEATALVGKRSIRFAATLKLIQPFAG